jgi:hypothetical protein
MLVLCTTKACQDRGLWRYCSSQTVCKAGIQGQVLPVLLDASKLVAADRSVQTRVA